MVQDSNNSSSISGMDIAAAAQHHNSAATGAFPANMVARSCPKPILMSRRSRQGSLTTNQDELTVFIPPHELSLLDPASVSVDVVVVCVGEMWAWLSDMHAALVCCVHAFSTASGHPFPFLEDVCPP